MSTSADVPVATDQEIEDALPPELAMRLRTLADNQDLTLYEALSQAIGVDEIIQKAQRQPREPVSVKGAGGAFLIEFS